MTPEQIKEKRQEKIAQIRGLMKVLKIQPQAIQKVNAEGVIENIVMFIDQEVYVKAEENPKKTNTVPVQVNKKKKDEKTS